MEAHKSDMTVSQMNGTCALSLIQGQLVLIYSMRMMKSSIKYTNLLKKLCRMELSGKRLVLATKQRPTAASTKSLFKLSMKSHAVDMVFKYMMALIQGFHYLNEWIGKRQCALWVKRTGRFKTKDWKGQFQICYSGLSTWTERALPIHLL